MNEVLNNIITRRSVRAFTDEQIKDDDLQLILKAGIYAPSGMNRQSWRFTVVQNAQIIEKLENLIKTALGREKYNMYGCKTIIMLSNDRDNSNGLADCACALQNIFLAANSLGIGSCWINQLKTICDEPQIRSMLTQLEIPANHIVWGIAALGYPKANEPVKDRNMDVVKYF